MNASGCRGVIDLHHHLLPGVDDGAADVATALAMARIALDEGIATIVATPHTLDGVHDVPRRAAAVALAELATALAAAGLPLTVRLAGEVHLHEDAPGMLDDDPGLSLDGRGRYLLLELPQQGPTPALPHLLFGLATRGTTAVIAHPERYVAVRDRTAVGAELVQRGCLLQITAGSLTGAFGGPIRRCAENLLRAGVVHVVATDAHSPGKRAPRVQDAFAAAAAIVGDDDAHRLFVDNPAGILAGVPASDLAPATPRRRRGIFAGLLR